MYISSRVRVKKWCEHCEHCEQVLKKIVISRASAVHGFAGRVGTSENKKTLDNQLLMVYNETRLIVLCWTLSADK